MQITLPNPNGDQKVLRITLNPNEDIIEQTPSRPMSGKKLPVFGISGAGAAAGAGGGATTASRIGSSAGGGGGGGGMVPATCCSC
jgi:hypothetical protein